MLPSPPHSFVLGRQRVRPKDVSDQPRRACIVAKNPKIALRPNAEQTTRQHRPLTTMSAVHNERRRSLWNGTSRSSTGGPIAARGVVIAAAVLLSAYATGVSPTSASTSGDAAG